MGLDRRSGVPYLRHVVEALVAIAIVAGILFYASRPHGWNAVSDANRARAEARLLARGEPTIAGHPAPHRLRHVSGQHVGIVQDADGAAPVGGRVRLPGARSVRRPLPAEVQAPRAVVPADRAGDRRARARVVAPAGRRERRPRQLLRVPERRPGRRRPRPVGVTRPRDDARAARDERLRLGAATAPTSSRRAAATAANTTCTPAPRSSPRCSRRAGGCSRCGRP